jgi:hypothetical protein
VGVTADAIAGRAQELAAVTFALVDQSFDVIAAQP